MAKVPAIDRMADNAKEGEEDWEPVKDDEEDLYGNDSVDEAGQDFPRRYCVLFN